MLTANVLAPAARRIPLDPNRASSAVGKGEFAQPFDRLGNHKQSDDPARQVADGIEESVITVKGDHAANAQKGRGGQIIAGKGHAIDEPGNLAVRREVSLRRLGAAAQIKAQQQRGADKQEEDDDSQYGRFVDHRPDSSSSPSGPHIQP